MASDKKRRKEANAKRKAANAGKPFVHPDGDRRRREECTAYPPVRDKRAWENYMGGPVADEEPARD